MHVGVVRVVDKLIEHPGFTNAISLIRHAAFVVGAESVRKVAVGVGSEGASACPLVASHVVSMNDVLLSFASMDHASFLGLGDLDIEGLPVLCSFSSSGGTPEGMVVEREETVEVIEDNVGKDGQGVEDGSECNIGVGGEGPGGEVIGLVAGMSDENEDALASCATPYGV